MISDKIYYEGDFKNNYPNGRGEWKINQKTIKGQYEQLLTDSQEQQIQT